MSEVTKAEAADDADDAASEPGTVDALARHLDSDPALLSVQSMMNMVDLVCAFGPLNRSRTLGSPALVGRIRVLVAAYRCPVCRPWEFGMARAYLALALAWGGSRFDEATALLQWTRSELEGAVVASDSEVLQCVNQTLLSVGRREQHPWFY